MAFWECNTCFAKFYDVLPDGMLYFHTCSPFPAWEMHPGKERPGRRDENIDLREGSNYGNMKRQGKGRSLLPTPIITE